MDTLAPVRVLVVSNLTPDEAAPARGIFVRDQIRALRDSGLDVEELWFPLGKRQYPRAVRRIRGLLREQAYDVVHAHYGLAGWCAALAGARPLVVTFHGTDVRHPTVGRLSRRLVRRLDLTGAASRALFGPEAGRPGLTVPPGRRAVLPCGADLERYRPLPRLESRQRVGLAPEGRYLLFPAASFRPEKRYDRAAQVANLAEAELLSGGDVPAKEMPDWINAADAVLITSENEGFGLVAIEALACDVPVLSTPVGVAPTLLGGIDGCLVAPFEPEIWAAAARRHLDRENPRVEGRDRAGWFAAKPMAERVIAAYGEVIERSGSTRPARARDVASTDAAKASGS